MAINIDLGFSELAELERAIRRLEDEIAAKAPANSELSPDELGALTQGVPQITGFTTTSKLGKIVLKWNKVPISDLKRYEIQVSLTSDFANPETFFTRETSWTYNEGDIGTTYFFRVRARNISEAVGLYSAKTSNTEATPAPVVEEDLDESITLGGGAITNLYSAFTEGSTTAGGGAETEVQVLVATLTGTKVIVFFTLEVKPTGFNHSPEYRLYRNSVKIYTRIQFTRQNEENIISFYFIETPPSGSTEYSLRMSVGAGGSFAVKGRGVLVLET